MRLVGRTPQRSEDCPFGPWRTPESVKTLWFLAAVVLPCANLLDDPALLAQTQSIGSPGLLITEFMAGNGSMPPLREGDLLDEDGDSSDWIEIYNPTHEAMPVGGWYLTDDPHRLTKWQFPQCTVGPSEFLVVFASGKDRAVPGGALHTNFRLDVEGEYLALVGADGVTVVHEYAPTYPPQRTDVSYGLSQQAQKLVASGAIASYHVPTASEAGVAWMAPGFNDSKWDQGATGVGFSAGAALVGQDIGGPARAGSFIQSGDTFSVRGGGRDIWDTADQFFYVCQPLSGDGQIIARVRSVDNTDVWAKAGVMIRESLDANSKNVMADVTSANGVSFQRRRSTGGGGEHTTIGGLSTPYWVRLVRRGDTFTGYRSPDGRAWTVIDSDVIAMARDLVVGLAVTAHNDAGPLCTAVFEHVTLGSDVTTNLKEKMLGVNASLWMRIGFEAEDVDSIDSLALRMKYEDAFVAYLNGVEIARENFGAAPAWDSVADGNRPNSLVGQFTTFDVSDPLGVLRTGHNVLAIHAMNDDKRNPEFLVLPELVAAQHAMIPQYFTTATPGQLNGPGAAAFVAEARFDHVRGFYEAPFAVTVTCDSPGAAIHFTTDGSVPTETQGSLYVGPIPVQGTMTLRAVAVKPGWLSSAVSTHTYLFLADVVRQSTLSKTITGDRTWGPQLRDALLGLPSISLAAAHPFSEAEGQASIELIFPDGEAGFQADAGVELFGGTSLAQPKNSMRISFKRVYGSAKLRFDLFGSCPFGGSDATDEFDQILLRSGSHDAMYWIQPGTGAKGVFVRNRWITDRQLEMGQPAPRSRFVHVYINGVYWGLYQLMERPNASFMASYFGGTQQDYDAVKGDYGNLNVLNGDASAWVAMVASTGNYEALQQFMDVVNYADYLLVNFYGGNDWDWLPYQNWMAARRREAGAGYKFFCWDNDVVLRTGPSANVVNQGGPGDMLNAIRQHEDFRMLLADRAQRIFFNGGMLTRDRVLAELDDLAGEIEKPIIAECARWGAAEQYTPATWREHLNWVKTVMIPQRTEVVLQQMRAAGLFPRVDAPTFSQQGGHVQRAFPLTLSAPSGTIYYALDGSDPRLPARARTASTGSGVSPNAIPYRGQITLTLSTQVKARALSGGTWSALREAVFDVGD